MWPTKALGVAVALGGPVGSAPVEKLQFISRTAAVLCWLHV